MFGCQNAGSHDNLITEVLSSELSNVLSDSVIKYKKINSSKVYCKLNLTNNRFEELLPLFSENGHENFEYSKSLDLEYYAFDKDEWDDEYYYSDYNKTKSLRYSIYYNKSKSILTLIKFNSN